MTFADLVSRWLEETLQTALPLFGPEAVLTLTVVLLLLGRVVGWEQRLPAALLVLIGTGVAFGLSWLTLSGVLSGTIAPNRYFAGMLTLDGTSALVRALLLLFTVLWVGLTILTGLPDREDAPDFYTLALSALVGMLMMTGASHLLMVFLGIEMASVPCYVLAGYLKGQRHGSEAALKFVVYGAGSAGVLLYGISLVAGLSGTAQLHELMPKLAQVLGDSALSVSHPETRLLLLGLLMMAAGLAFKLALVPFHFWAPDTFHGAPAEVGAFLSVASKGASIALLMRLVLALAPAGPEAVRLYVLLGTGLGLLAALSVLFGTLAAYTQTNLKRLLAYSTIAHAGYLLMPVAALLATQAGGFSPEELARRVGRAQEAMVFYVGVMVFMNLGAFAVVALVRNELFSEDLSAYRGIGLHSPVLLFSLSLCLFSLVGLPPLGGFFAKWAVFATVYEAARDVHVLFSIPLFAGAAGTVLSLYYYLGVLKVMLFDAPLPGATQFTCRNWSGPSIYALLIAVPTLLLGLAPQWLSEAARTAATLVVPVP